MVARHHRRRWGCFLGPMKRGDAGGGQSQSSAFSSCRCLGERSVGPACYRRLLIAHHMYISDCVKVYHNEPFHFYTIAVCYIESPSTGKNSWIIKWDVCIISCVTLECYPTDEYKSNSGYWFFREQNSKPFIESKRAVQMFSTEKELKILNSKTIEYGMILNVKQSKAKFPIQMARRRLVSFQICQWVLIFFSGVWAKFQISPLRSVMFAIEVLLLFWTQHLILLNSQRLSASCHLVWWRPSWPPGARRNVEIWY